MNKVKRSWDLLSDREREKALSTIIDFYATELDEEIGLIAAEKILDMFLHQVGVTIYNKGIDNAGQFVKTSIDDALVNLEINLKKETNE